MSADRYIEVDGLRIKVKITGPGDEHTRTVVILQGWGTTCDLYDSIAGLLCDRYRVVQFDLPGFGDSEEPADSWSVGEYTAFFVRFLAKLDIRECILIGHSYGGRIVIKLASDMGAGKNTFFENGNHRIDITKIVLLDSAGIMPQRSFSVRAKQLSYKILKRIFANKLIYWLFPEIIDDWRSRQGSEDYRRATPVMRGALVKAVNEDLTDCLKYIKQDTLLIWGEDDTATPIRDAHIMEENIPAAGLCVIPGAGHFAYAEKPQHFAGILNAYLL